MYLCCGYPEKRRAGRTPEKDEPDYRYRWPTQQTLISQESDDVQTKLDRVLRAVGQPLLRFHSKTEDGRHTPGRAVNLIRQLTFYPSRPPTPARSK